MCVWVSVHLCFCVQECAPHGYARKMTPLWCLRVLTDSLSAQRGHTHGGRVRHSSSDSSGSDSSGESESSSRHSRSPSPESHSDPGSPANTEPRCTKEVMMPSSCLFLSFYLPCAFVAVSVQFWFLCLQVNSPQGAAQRQLRAGGGRDRGIRNACESERSTGRGGSSGIRALVSCQQAES